MKSAAERRLEKERRNGDGPTEPAEVPEATDQASADAPGASAQAAPDIVNISDQDLLAEIGKLTMQNNALQGLVAQKNEALKEKDDAIAFLTGELQKATGEAAC